MSCEGTEHQELFSEARHYFSALIAQSTFQNVAKTSTLIPLLHKRCAEILFFVSLLIASEVHDVEE